MVQYNREMHEQMEDLRNRMSKVEEDNKSLREALSTVSSQPVTPKSGTYRTPAGNRTRTRNARSRSPSPERRSTRTRDNRVNRDERFETPTKSKKGKARADLQIMIPGKFNSNLPLLAGLPTPAM